jgi:hypothetical protein
MVSVVGTLQFGRWDVAAVLVEASMVDQSTHWAVASSRCHHLKAQPSPTSFVTVT